MGLIPLFSGSSCFVLLFLMYSIVFHNCLSSVIGVRPNFCVHNDTDFSPSFWTRGLIPLLILYIRDALPFNFPTMLSTSSSSHTSKICKWSPQIFIAITFKLSSTTISEIVLIIRISSSASNQIG